VSLIQRAEASQKRINNFLDDKNIIESPSTLNSNSINSIVFNNVNFIYPDTGIEALTNINFELNKGEKIAIVGKTGSGKSTIAELLLRTYDIEHGEILINQQNIKNINLKDFRNKIGYTPQDVFLFSDTIKNNVLFGLENEVDKENQLEKVKHYTNIAHIQNEIEQLPKQYETVVGERGVMLSGGQKQRISIARSLVKEPELVILDDCLSAVDAKTEKIILNNLLDTLQNKTVVFITHRIFAAMNFDKILVLENGKIVEQGNHKTLIDLKGIYFDIYQLQQVNDN
jgi:ATP-binding cassette subfamily B protein